MCTMISGFGDLKIKDIDRRIADLVAINPRTEQPRALVAMGHELVSRDVDAATKCFDKALAIDPRFVPAWIGRAEALTAKGNRAQAMGCIERALDVEPKSADLAERKAKLLSELAVASSRNRRFEMPSSSDPVAPPPSSSSNPVAAPAPSSTRSTPELDLDTKPKSEPKPAPKSEPKPKSEPEPKPEPKSDPEVAPKSVDPAYDDAAMLLAAGKHIEALRKIEPLTKAPDAKSQVWMLRGAICTALTQHEAAVTSYERATKADPKSVEAWLGLAKSRVDSKALERGLDAADQALRLAPFDGAVQKLRGRILIALMQGTAAVTAFEKATQHAPDDAEAWLELGKALRAVRKPDAARGALQRALSIAETMKPELVPDVCEVLEKLK